MNLSFRASVLHSVNSPLRTETVEVAGLAARDVLVRICAAGLCHTDLEVIDGSLRQPLPIVLGHEAAGVVEAVGPEAGKVAVGDHVILSWNPHCGHCFYCDHSLPILCETYLANTPAALAFDGRPRARLSGGEDLHQLMYMGAFGEFCVVQDQQAIPIPKEMPFPQAALIGCGVMTGVGAAINVAQVAPGSSVMVIGCGAVGLATIQGAVLGGADRIIAVDLQDSRLEVAKRMGASVLVNPARDDAVQAARDITSGRGVDTILESAGNEPAFRLTVEAVRPGGQVIWLGKTDVNKDVSFRWGSLMQEKRIRRSSYGDARPARDFPFLCRAYLDGRLDLDALISQEIGLDQINEGFAALRAGETIRSIVTF
ncbi:Zn-dependent alcohol dehydrogenase [Paracoccus onubensis]|uniref:Zn-dependent alcohol dehydrogenase n=1 Tax=Paracoccus onubensis TaxID=1675788 RepID=UPI002731F2FB|nr:Zn-dependent alcohol dehydrogenase [Paracoccus onubensis]MDP0928945.1 Zn-dependent alcohol dehydrogenase [Paracoccus onubensis]